MSTSYAPLVLENDLLRVEVPTATMSLRGEPTVKGGGTLIAVDDGDGHMHDWAMALPIGGSRLIVCANISRSSGWTTDI